MLRQFLTKITGYSVSQLSRLISKHQRCGKVEWKPARKINHINAVDEVPQFEVVCTVGRITAHYMIPILTEIMAKFPFRIINFHSDNGTEYINGEVDKLLNDLLVDFIKSRSRKSNDNALAESKNASVVRKIFGYTHIPQTFAPLINQFNCEVVYPYINYHKPCAFPETTVDKKAKRKRFFFKKTE